MAGPSLNEVRLIGRLTKDPERLDGNNSPRVRYTLAVDRGETKSGGSNADFINCVAFDKLVEPAMQYLTKGSLVMVLGSLRVDFVTDNQTGKNTVYSSVTVKRQIFLDPKTQQPSQQYQPQNNGYGGNGYPQNNYPSQQQGGYNQYNNGYQQPPTQNGQGSGGYNNSPQQPPRQQSQQSPQQNQYNNQGGQNEQMNFDNIFDDFGYKPGEPF